MPGPPVSRKVLAEDARVEARARAYYPLTDYHFYDGHVSTLLTHANTHLLPAVRKAGLKFNERALKHGIQWHDALYPIDHTLLLNPETGKPFSSKEELSAHVARHELRKLGLPEKHVQMVYDIIMATQPGVEPVTIEQKLMRALDLHNLTYDYETFSKNWDQLRQEAEHMRGMPINKRDWANSTASFLPLFLWTSIHLTEGYYNANGASAFHNAAIRNIVRKLRETIPGWPQRVIVEIGPNASPLTTRRKLSPKTFYVGIDSDPQKLRQALSLSREVYAPTQKKPTVFFVPGEARSIPLDDKFAHEVVLHDTGELPLSEIGRVLKSGGTMEVELRGAIKEAKIRSLIAKIEKDPRYRHAKTTRYSGEKPYASISFSYR